MSDKVHVVHKPRPNDRQSPLHTVMQPASYPLMDEVA
jgi:hypothetical protein